MKKYEFQLAEYWDYKRLPEGHPLIKTAAGYCLNHDESKLFVFGGFDKKNNLSNILITIDTNDFHEEAQTPIDIEGRINNRMYYWNNKIIFIGGTSYDYSKPMKLFNEIVILELPEYRVETIDLKEIGLQFTSFFDYENGNLYYAGGLDFNNIIYKVNIKSKEIEEIRKELFVSRCGATSISFEDKAILFSGFRKEGNNPICYSDYYIFGMNDGKIKYKQCNEFVGRTFSKAVLLEKYHKILFLLGTYNGMEASHSGIYYNYKKDVFDGIYMQEIPIGVTEPIIFHLKNSNKVYIVGGISNDEVQEIMWELDLSKVPGFAV